MQVHENNLAFISIKDATGNEAGRLFYIPYDTNLFSRASKFVQALSRSDTYSVLAMCNIASDGRGIDPYSEKTINDLEKQVIDGVDSLCGVITSSEVFREYKPFAIMSDGKFWLTKVFDAIHEAARSIVRNMNG